MANVPCNGCTACCLGSDVAPLAPEDDPRLWNLYPSGFIPRTGRCPLLGKVGCTVHSYRPTACQNFDCRPLYTKWKDLSLSGKKRVMRNVKHAGPVLKAGAERQNAWFTKER